MGIPRTLVGGMLLHSGVLFLIAAFSQSAAFMFPLLMIWAFSAWSSGPTQQYYLITLAPEASGIMLSLNSSVLQLAMAAGAGIGGVVVESVSLSAIGWLGAAGVAIAAAMAAGSFGLSRAGARARIAEQKLRVTQADPETASS